MKRYKFLILLFVLLTMFGNKTYAYSIAVDNEDGVTIYYDYYNGGTELQVTYGSYSGNVVIPSSVTYNGKTYSVTSIFESAFSQCSNLTSVTIPSSVKSIGRRAFSNCTKLKSMIIPEGVTSISERLFNGCSSLTNVTIPNSVTSIGSYAFEDCSSLKRVNIPSCVNSIGYGAFIDCTSLEKVIVPDITAWCKINFSKQSSAKAFSGFSNPLKFAHNIYSDENTKITDLVIPNSVESISSFAFEGCSMVSLSIPSSVTSIGDGAFNNCTELLNVTIPSSVSNIGNYTFGNCTSLMSVTIPSTVKTIDWFAFENCTGLLNLTIPEGVESIGWNAFSNCTSLSELNIYANLTSIGSGAFSDCRKLKKLSVYATDIIFTGERDHPIFEGSNQVEYLYANSEQFPPISTDNLVTLIIGDDVTRFARNLDSSYRLKTISLGRNVNYVACSVRDCVNISVIYSYSLIDILLLRRTGSQRLKTYRASRLR